MFTECYVLSYS